MVNTKKIEVDISGTGHITNTYLVYNNEGKGVVIDPGDQAHKIINEIKKLDLEIVYVIITHAHGDHIGALEELLDFAKESKVVIHQEDYEGLLGKVENYSEMLGVSKQYIDESRILKVNDKDILKIDNIEFEVIHTPGHTKGSICLFEKNIYTIFTGDTIFCNCYGRCDLYGGDINKMVESLKKVFSRFDDIKIHPGHDSECDICIAKKKISMLLSINKGIKI